jgi:FAD/FMN-containing dehydrogenase
MTRTHNVIILNTKVKWTNSWRSEYYNGKQINMTYVGHVGDGNFHVFFPVDHDNVEELQKVQEISKKMAL